MKVGIVGASGYVGGELLRLLLFHEKVEVAYATSREYEGELVYRVHPNLRKVTDLVFTKPDPAIVAKDCDLVFTAVPHGAAVKLVSKYLEQGVKVVDMSADARLKEATDYEKWYGFKHADPELLKKAIYGMPELHREEIKNARLVACPGCMATASILALAPIFKANLVDLNKIVVDAKIGSSGSGAKPSLSTHHAERFGVVRSYKPVGHRHTAEIEQELSRLAGEKITVSMSPHAVNMVRGILSTCHVFLNKPVKGVEVWKIYRSMYQDEPFIRLVRDKKGIFRLPDPKIVIGSNFCDVGFELDEHSTRLVALGAIDNLIKGAAGQAVQDMNIMSGFDEREGLKMAGLHPV
jgi:LysW-gamma-L-alpha-aminoadipyl-6-phosphate/LysW-L-glutamyl-5-phosphate reductase